MDRTTELLAAFACLLSATAATASDGAEPPGPVRALIDSTCVDCHGPGYAEGGLDFESLPFDLSDAEARRVWERVHDRVESGEMPPPEDYGRLDASETAPALGELRREIDAAYRGARERRGGRAEWRRLTAGELESVLAELLGPFPDPHLVPEEVPHGEMRAQAEHLPLADWRLRQFVATTGAAVDAALARLRDRGGPAETWIPGREMLERDGRGFALHLDGDSYSFITKGSWKTSMTFRWAVPAVGWYRVEFVGSAHQADGPVPFRLHAGRTADWKAMRTVGVGDVDADGAGRTVFWVKMDAGEGL